MKVLVLDRSPFFGQALARALSDDPAVKIATIATDPYRAMEAMRQSPPDVALIDDAMPNTEGARYLAATSANGPIPVVRMRTTEDGLLRSAHAGGAKSLVRPPNVTDAYVAENATQIRLLLLGASADTSDAIVSTDQKLRPDALLPPPAAARRPSGPVGRVIAIGSSTGGIDALLTLVGGLPADCPPGVIVQHLPSGYSASFADRLNRAATVNVAEARPGDRLTPGRVLIAPPGRHTVVRAQPRGHVIDLLDGPPISRHRPSADVLFRSVAIAAGDMSVGVILTGMGDDGAIGLRELREAGGRTLGQDEASCVIYGMPKAARDAGAVEKEVPLDRMAGAIQALIR